jgi:hypothetical protein
MREKVSNKEKPTRIFSCKVPRSRILLISYLDKEYFREKKIPQRVHFRL